MDVILEVADTFVGDYVYAWAHPARQALYDLPSQTNQTSQLLSSWAYEPSSIYFSLEPSQYAYMSAWDRENIVRQTISLFFITWIFGTILYFMFSTLSYYTIYDHKQMEHPKFLKNQVYLEMMQAITSVPVMSALTTPCWLLDVRGFTKLYGTSAEGPGAWYDYLQFPFFIILTDACIYLIHRGLHHPLVYKHLHKPHHKWIVPTPFASYAFHPVDGFLQSVPYHIFPMLFPLNKYASVFLFVFVNFWTILIHDGEYMANSPIINGAACHTLHHLYFNYNYGQYTTLWDRLGGSYRKPDDALFQKEAKLSANEWKKQTTEMEKIVKEVEGVDDRTYDPADVKKTN